MELVLFAASVAATVVLITTPNGMHNQLSKNLTEYDDCIQSWITKQPQLQERFKTIQLAWLCERTEQWLQKALAPPEVQNEPAEMTSSQAEWLFNLRNCAAAECLKDAICKEDRCNKRQEEVPASAASEISEGQVTPSPRPKAAHDIDVNRIDPDSISKNFSEIKTEEEEKFRLRRCRIGRVCVRVEAASDADEAFPGMQNKTTAERAQKFKTWMDKCEKIRARIIKRNETFADWTADPKCHEKRTKVKKEHRRKPRLEIPIDALNVQHIDLGSMHNKQDIALTCLHVLESANATEAFPDFPREQHNWERQLRTQFNQWTRKCNLLQNRLEDELGLTFEDWIGAENKTATGEEKDDHEAEEEHNREHQRHGQNRSRNRHRQDRRRNDRSLDFVFDFEDPEIPSHLRQSRQTQGQQHPAYDAAQYDALYDVPFAHASLKSRRKEYRMTTKAERQKIHAAFNALKKNKIDNMSKYDLLTIYHTPMQSPGAHWGPAFLPFHREMMKQLEMALRAEDPDVFLPYWDSTLDDGLPHPADSILWSDEFFGNGDGLVTTGPFANWEATHDLSAMPGMRKLFRETGASPFGGFYKPQDIEFIMSRQKFDDLTACVDPTFELVHGLVHMWVGGYMADIGISPNDPTFYFHHTFIDYLWEEFRLAKQTRDQRQLQYPPNEKSCNNFHYGDSQMQPFPIKNIDGLMNNYTDIFYEYDPRPTCSNSVPNCASEYIFCDTTHFRCLSKIKLGGNCTGFENMDSCYGGRCENDVCVSTKGETTEAATETTTPTTVLHTTTSIHQEVSTVSGSGQESSTTTTISTPETTTPTTSETTTTSPWTLIPGLDSTTISTPETTTPIATTATSPSTLIPGLESSTIVIPDTTTARSTTTTPLGTLIPGLEFVTTSSPQTTVHGIGPELNITTTPVTHHELETTTTTGLITFEPQSTATTTHGLETTSTGIFPTFPPETTTTSSISVTIPGVETTVPLGTTSTPELLTFTTSLHVFTTTASPEFTTTIKFVPPTTESTITAEILPVTTATIHSTTHSNSIDAELPTTMQMTLPSQTSTTTEFMPRTTTVEILPVTSYVVSTDTTQPHTTTAPHYNTHQPETPATTETSQSQPTTEPSTTSTSYVPHSVIETLSSSTSTPTTTQFVAPTTLPATIYSVSTMSTQTVTGTTIAGYVPQNVVYCAITVVRGAGYYKVPVNGAQINSAGLDRPPGYTATYQGKSVSNSTYPSFTGAALVPIKAPAGNAQDLVEAEIAVKDGQGRNCESWCYGTNTNGYARCNSNRIRISHNAYYSDPIICKETEKDALEAMWQQDGYYRRRIPTYLQYQCP